MEPSRGRTVDYFELPGGRLVAPYSLTCAIEPVAGMRQYQIVQEARDRVTVKVVPTAEFDAEAAQRIVDLLKPLLIGVVTGVKVVDAIPAEASGKYRIVRSDVGVD
jgi:hypothetical protein